MIIVDFDDDMRVNRVIRREGEDRDLSVALTMTPFPMMTAPRRLQLVEGFFCQSIGHRRTTGVSTAARSPLSYPMVATSGTENHGADGAFGITMMALIADLTCNLAKHIFRETVEV